MNNSPRKAKSARSNGAKTIRWMVAHFRGHEDFDAQLQGFARRLAQASEGRLNVEFSGTTASRENGLRRDIEGEEAYKAVTAGEAEMAQLDVVQLGLSAIESPFVFRNYDHAEAVWTGKLGERLLEDVPAFSGGAMRGLAFSYSGGFRILVGQTSVRSAEDFKGVRIREVGTSRELFRKLKASLIAPEKAKTAPGTPRLTLVVAGGGIDLEETELNQLAYFKSRFPAECGRIKFINLTRHSMLVTAMVVNEKFFAGLDDGLRKILEREVRALAVEERKLSVDLAKRNLEALRAGGISVVALPEREEQKLAAMAEQLADSSPRGPLIRELRAADEARLPAGKRLAAAGQA